MTTTDYSDRSPGEKIDIEKRKWIYDKRYNVYFNQNERKDGENHA